MTDVERTATAGTGGQHLESLDDDLGRGRTTIADKAIERIATRAAQEVPAVQGSGARWGLPVLGASLPKTTARVAGGRVRISVAIAAQWPSSTKELAAEVREHVQSRVTTMTSMSVEAVDVTVADLIRTESKGRRVR